MLKSDIRIKFFYILKIDQKQDKDLNKFFFSLFIRFIDYLILLLFYTLSSNVLSLTISLVISRIILTNNKVAMSLSKWFL